MMKVKNIKRLGQSFGVLCLGGVLALGSLSSCGTSHSSVGHDDALVTVDKPVVYLYPDSSNTVCDVTLIDMVDKNIDISYPTLENNMWTVSANPDGRLFDTKTNREYGYLFWEDENMDSYEITAGSCVRGKDVKNFLEVALSQMGLNDKEADDFITYWLPKLEKNEYNMIQFNPQEYFDRYFMSVSPRPKNMISAFMVAKAVDKPMDVPLQDYPNMNNVERNGFTVVEWGGTFEDLTTKAKATSVKTNTKTDTKAEEKTDGKDDKESDGTVQNAGISK